MRGSRRGDGLRQPGGRGDRRVRVAAGPDVGDRDGVGTGEDVGERVEQRRRPVVGQRLVHGPDAPAGLALADRGQRLADRRRVVAVVVVHDDARAPRPCARAAARRPRTPPRPATIAPAPTPDGGRRARDPQRVRGVVAARGRQARGDRAGERVEAERSRAWSPRGRAAVIRPEERRRGPAAVAEPLGDPAGEPAGALRRDVHERRRDDPPGPVGEPRDELGDARRRRRSRRAPAAAGRRRRRRPPRAGSSASNAASTAARSANTSGWSHSAEVRTATAGPVRRRSCRRTRPPRRRTASPSPRRAVAGDADPGQRRRQQRADERARVRARRPPARGPASPPSCSCRASPRPPTSVRPRGRVGDDLLPRLERDAGRPRGGAAPGCPDRSP